jgi:NADH:ubiquinone oxidoreductase subunit E
MEAKVDQIIERNGTDPAALLAVLQDIQAEFNYLPRPALERVAMRLNLSLGRVSYMATFFRSFSLKQRGKHICTVCLGTACHVRGAPRLVEELERVLELKAGETSADKQFTLETVNCVGACALGPLVILDGEYHGTMNASKIERLVRATRKKD